jgi:hypothetical protein
MYSVKKIQIPSRSFRYSNGVFRVNDLTESFPWKFNGLIFW